MLCDDVSEYFRSGVSDIRPDDPPKKLRMLSVAMDASHKFFFEDFSLIDPLLSEQELPKARQLMRLPHAATWVEMDAVLPGANGPCRVGALLFPADGAFGFDEYGWFGRHDDQADQQPGVAMFAFTRRPGEEFGWQSGIVVWPHTMHLDSQGQVSLCSMMHGKPGAINKDGSPTEVTDAMNMEWAEEFAVEVIPIYKALAFINSPALVATTERHMGLLNQKRQRTGKAPLNDYTVVRIDKKVRRLAEESKQNREVGNVRFHWRRGHFKCRKTGMFWWNPHTAGHKELGVIEKEYIA